VLVNLAYIKTSLAGDCVRQLRAVVGLDLPVNPRNPEASVRFALRDVRRIRCNGHGRSRIVGSSAYLK